MLTYHIYNDAVCGWKWTIKDPTKTTVIYTIDRERHLCSPHKYRLYRDSPDAADSSACIATIERSKLNRRWHILIHSTEEKVYVHSHRILSSEWSFEHAGEEYHWTAERNLKDSKGNVIAVFDPRRFGWKKVGTLSVKEDQIDKLDVILGTALIIGPN